MLGLNSHNRVISVPRLSLLEKLKENQAIHEVEYRTALEDYRVALLKDLKKATREVNALTDDTLDSIVDVTVDFDRPVSHREDYRKAIQMLEFSTVELIEVDESAFEAYVNNNWPWKHSFYNNVTKLAAISGRA